MPLSVSIVTPEREVFAGEANFVIARSADGDVGVLPGHAPFLGNLHHARLIVERESGQTYVAIHGGFIQVFEDKVTVLTGTAELAEEIDTEAARKQREEAQRACDVDDTPENRAALLKASNRVQTAAEAGLLDIG